MHPTHLDPIPIGQAILQKVVERMGGIAAASVALGVNPATVARYLDGSQDVPDDVLLRAIDIVLDELPVLLTNSQPFRRSPE